MFERNRQSRTRTLPAPIIFSPANCTVRVRLLDERRLWTQQRQRPDVPLLRLPRPLHWPRLHPQNIPQDELEAMVVNSVADLLLEPELLEQIADAIVELQQAEAARPDPEKQALENPCPMSGTRSRTSSLPLRTAPPAPPSLPALPTWSSRRARFPISSLPSMQKPLTFTRDQILFLLQQFRVSPRAHQGLLPPPVDTFVDHIELTNTELILYFNLSDETVDKKKSSPVEPFRRKFDREALVRVARIELTAS